MSVKTSDSLTVEWWFHHSIPTTNFNSQLHLSFVEKRPSTPDIKQNVFQVSTEYRREKKFQARKENTQNKINTQQQSCVTMNTKIKSQLSVSEVDIYVAQIKKILTQKEFRPFSNSTVWKLNLFWRDNNVCWTFWRLFWNVFFFVSGVVLSSFPVEFFMFNACF